jgi:hypothetical protein
MKTCKRTTVTPVLRPHPLRKAIRELIQRPGHSRLLAGGVVTASLIGIASPTLGQTLELSDLDGSNGFVVNGIDARDYSGESVAAAGDINGDGLDDVIIGATSADPYGTYDAGESYIVFGRSTGFPAALDLADLDGSNGLVVNGIGTEDSSGGSVAAAGDVNGDGLDDVIIAAAYADSNGTYNAGESYIVFGRSTGFPAALDLADLDGSNGFVVNGTDVDDRSGGNVASVGDVNGDGLDDVIIVAWRADPNGLDGAGESYIVFGRSTGFPAALNVADLDGSNGFVVNGIDAFDYAGFSVAGAGDINGDGVDDVIIGAIGADPNGTYIAGESYVVFGRTAEFSASLDLADLDGSNGFVMHGIDQYDQAGRSVAGAGDINGDGVDDVIIGATGLGPNGNDGAGKGYVVFGRNTDFPASLDLADLDGSAGFVVKGIDAYDYAGFPVAAAGDINGDGLDDVIIGAGSADPNGLDLAGESYIVFGRSTGFPAALNLADLDGSNGFVVNGIDVDDLSGRRVAAAGDINGDGLDDVIIGAFMADPNGIDRAGETYVVFGSEGTGVTIRFQVQCPGDVNGDGIADMAVVRSDGSVHIKDLNGATVSEFDLSDITAVVDVELMADITTNGSPELVVLGTGSAKAEVWDTFTGSQLSVVDFDPSIAPLDLELIPDQNANGIPELASLGEGSVIVEAIDGLSADLINSVSFRNYIQPTDLEIYPDSNSNGSPELAVLGDNKDAAKSDKVEIRDLATGNVTKSIWLGKGWRVLQQELIADRNGNGAQEVAVLRVKNNDDAVKVMLRDTKTGARLGSIRFDRIYPPTHLRTISDVNGNGADEIVVFGQRSTGGIQKAQIKDSKSKALIRNLFFGQNFPAQDFTTCSDINGNGTEELVRLGKRASDGKLRAVVKDAKTGELIGTVDF